MLASIGVLSLFLELHDEQQVIKFSHEFLPFLDLGKIWSIVKLSVDKQYAQVKSSL
jgi:hypothetical protein